MFRQKDMILSFLFFRVISWMGLSSLDRIWKLESSSNASKWALGKYFTMWTSESALPRLSFSTFSLEISSSKSGCIKGLVYKIVAYWGWFLWFILLGYECELVRHKPATFVEKDGHVVKTVNWNNSLLYFQNLELFIYNSVWLFVWGIQIDHF